MHVAPPRCALCGFLIAPAPQLAPDDFGGAANIAAAFQEAVAAQLRTRVDRALRWAELQHALGSDRVTQLVCAACGTSRAACVCVFLCVCGCVRLCWRTRAHARSACGSVGFAQVVCGGVARNSFLRREIETVCGHFGAPARRATRDERNSVAYAGVQAVYPPPRLCTDNGVMVAWAGMEQLAAGQVPAPLGDADLSPRWVLGEPQPNSGGRTL